MARCTWRTCGVCKNCHDMLPVKASGTLQHRSLDATCVNPEGRGASNRTLLVHSQKKQLGAWADDCLCGAPTAGDGRFGSGARAIVMVTTRLVSR